eukprot:203714-Amorphochlora_amoeboformis.AAC.2
MQWRFLCFPAVFEGILYREDWVWGPRATWSNANDVRILLFVLEAARHGFLRKGMECHGVIWVHGRPRAWVTGGRTKIQYKTLDAC